MNATDQSILKVNQDARRRNLLSRMVRVLRSQDWLALMLLGLHAALVFDIETWVAKSFLLFHFGCFLLWQPVVRSEQKLYWGQTALVLGSAAVLLAAQSLWFMALWIAMLLALIGGQTPALKSKSARIVALLAATYLLSILLIWVVPHLLMPSVYPYMLMQIVRYAPVAIIGLIFLVRIDSTDAGNGASSTVDLLYSLLLFFLVIVLVLGAFVIRQINNTNYVLALAQTLLVIAALLVALSWMWDPRAGFTGLGQLLTKYFLSVGTPFERWMQRLADFAQHEREPDRFLSLAIQEIATLPWISGVEWTTNQYKGSAGHISKHATDCSVGDLRLNVYTRWTPGPSLIVHMRLLTRLLADYYEAKIREQEQRNNAYMRAIYETGTRLTHDVKNLLQSLRSLCSAVETSREQEEEALRGLVQRQLPQITQRLQATLDKLSLKSVDNVDWIAAREWWDAFQQRHSSDEVSFELGALPQDAQIPVELFDSVAENLVNNALAKRQLHAGLGIQVRLDWSAGVALSVADDGKAIPDVIAKKLFWGPVPSTRGLGVGLYQAARQARSIGFGLTLSSNEPGKVTFVLAK